MLILSFKSYTTSHINGRPLSFMLQTRPSRLGGSFHKFCTWNVGSLRQRATLCSAISFCYEDRQGLTRARGSDVGWECFPKPGLPLTHVPCSLQKRTLANGRKRLAFTGVSKGVNFLTILQNLIQKHLFTKHSWIFDGVNSRSCKKIDFPTAPLTWGGGSLNSSSILLKLPNVTGSTHTICHGRGRGDNYLQCWTQWGGNLFKPRQSSPGSDFKPLVCFCQINFDPESLPKQNRRSAGNLSWAHTEFLFFFFLIRSHSRNVVLVSIKNGKNTIDHTSIVTYKYFKERYNCHTVSGEESRLPEKVSWDFLDSDSSTVCSDTGAHVQWLAKALEQERGGICSFSEVSHMLLKRGEKNSAGVVEASVKKWV